MSDSRGTVFLVDDDAAVRQSLKFALELEGLDVRLYDGGPELLAEPELPPSGCLVLDYKMPAMDGLEVRARLRARYVAMPTLLITSHADPALRDRAAAAGIRRVVEKPLSDSVLIDSIRDALGAAERRPT